MSVADNLELVREAIASAAKRAGRDAAKVRLVAVSKTKPISLIREAFIAGQTIFGENYVQEAVAKADDFPQAEWHLIGPMQSNKVKMIANKFALVHSVDREKIALEIAKVAEQGRRVQDILLQIHVGDEATKHGLSFAEAPPVIEKILARKSLRLRGLMALPPLTDDEKTGRAQFASLREALEQWRKAYLPAEAASEFNELSMGTSSDFEWAVLEGATLVRVGTSIFGERS
jgi:pyridoxal phosphate enzyme (YggS family)